MLLKIHAQGFDLTDSFHSYVDSKIRLILGRFIEKIQRIDAFLVDLNGPKGGEDKRCKLVIKLDKSMPFTVQDTSLNLYEAMCSASHRGKRKIERHIRRVKHNRYRPKQQRAALVALADDILLEEKIING